MRRRFAYLLPLLLALVLAFGTVSPIATPAAAADETIILTEEQAAVQVFQNLAPEAQAEFLAFIEQESAEGRPELLQFHKTVVDPSYVSAKTGSATFAAASAGSLSKLNARLLKLKLPTPVYYSLVGVGGGIASAGADGPLPVGDIVAVIISLGAAGVICYYWDDVAPKWDSIVDAFEDTFTDMKRAIQEAFLEFEANIIKLQIAFQVWEVPGTVTKSAQKHMEKSLTKKITNNIKNRNSKNNMEVFLNKDDEVMVVFDITTSTKGLVNRHLSNYLYKELYEKGYRLADSSYKKQTLDLSGYTAFLVYKEDRTFHNHFTPTRLRDRELKYQRYNGEYVWRIYPKISYSNKYDPNKNNDYEKEWRSAMRNRGLGWSSATRSYSVVPYK